MYGYTFGSKWTERELSGDAVTGYFDLCNEVSKLAQMPTASLLFQRGDVQPARQLVKLDFDEHRLYDSLKEKRWDRVQFFTEGELSPLLPLVHRLRIDNSTPRTRPKPPRSLSSNRPAASPATPASCSGKRLRKAPEADHQRPAHASRPWLDRGQDAAHPRHRVPSHHAILRRQPHGARCKPLSASKKILLVAAARCANTGMQWNADRTSISDQWGGPPLLIEPVEGQIQLRHATGLESFRSTAPVGPRPAKNPCWRHAMAPA